MSTKEFTREYAKHYVALNKGKRYEQDINFIYDWAGAPNSILDLGCGPANYWQFYPAHVYLVGIERSGDMKRESPYQKRILRADINTVNYDLLRVGFRLVTALFDVVNYMPDLKWWSNLPLEKRGLFVFDVWDRDKISKEGFIETVREAGGVKRTIKPVGKDSRSVTLEITLESAAGIHKEKHRMYLYSHKQIEAAAKSANFIIAETKDTDTWQKWYKLRKI